MTRKVQVLGIRAPEWLCKNSRGDVPYFGRVPITPQARKAVSLRSQGHSYSQIGLELGISTTRANQLYRRAIVAQSLTILIDMRHIALSMVLRDRQETL